MPSLRTHGRALVGARYSQGFALFYELDNGQPLWDRSDLSMWHTHRVIFQRDCKVTRVWRHDYNVKPWNPLYSSIMALQIEPAVNASMPQ